MWKSLFIYEYKITMHINFVDNFLWINVRISGFLRYLKGVIHNFRKLTIYITPDNAELCRQFF